MGEYVYDKKEDKVLYEVPYSENGSLTLEVSKVPKGVKVKDKKITKKPTNNKTEIEKLKEKIKKLNDQLCDAQMENQRLEKYIEYNKESENLEILSLKTYIMSIKKWGDFIKKFEQNGDGYRIEIIDKVLRDEAYYRDKYDSLVSKCEKLIRIDMNYDDFRNIVNHYCNSISTNVNTLSNPNNVSLINTIQYDIGKLKQCLAFDIKKGVNNK